MKVPPIIFRQMKTDTGFTVSELSKSNRILLVFLRHFGCIFCREALDDLSKIKTQLERQNQNVVFVHMASPEKASPYFSKYNLDTAHKIADQDCTFYHAFGLMKGTFNQLFGFHSWLRGIEAGIIRGHGMSAQLGDGFQMPGVFVIENDEVVSHFIHTKVSDKPDYLSMVLDRTTGPSTPMVKWRRMSAK